VEIGHIYASNIPSPDKPFQDYLLQHANRNLFFMMPTYPIEVARIITCLKPKQVLDMMALPRNC
jgi:hypothetical protein